jgi:hypothetical protein
MSQALPHCTVTWYHIITMYALSHTIKTIFSQVQRIPELRYNESNEDNIPLCGQFYGLFAINSTAYYYRLIIRKSCITNDHDIN